MRWLRSTRSGDTTNHWKGNDPTLFDVLAVELVSAAHRILAVQTCLALFDPWQPDGLTSPVSGRQPSACEVALNVRRRRRCMNGLPSRARQQREIA
jgi:hypothetical protein